LESWDPYCLFIYWYHPASYQDYLEHAQWINIQLMERFNAEGIDFAFPSQTLHLAGDDQRPLTVGQQWESKEEAISPSTILAQAAALGAQAAQISQTSVSDVLRAEAKQEDPSEPESGGDLTDTPIEGKLLHGDSKGETA
jgi:MscS family membrane protein